MGDNVDRVLQVGLESQRSKTLRVREYCIICVKFLELKSFDIEVLT